jgi:hypothetical protein
MPSTMGGGLVEDDAPPATTNLLSGDILGVAVQAGSIKGDVHFHVTTAAQPAKPRAVAPPTDWTGLPELSPKIKSLLRAQIQAAEEMPYRLRGARRPSLSTVYVRQDVTSGTEAHGAEQSRPVPVLDDRGQLIDVPHPPITRLAVRPPSRSMREALDGDDHLLVSGGPGQGKSTLSLRLTADVAHCWQHDNDSPPLHEVVVPLRLTARELAGRLDLPFFEALAETVKVEYGALLAATIQPDDLAERVSGCRWLLLVDGLDEVADTAQRDRLVAVLSTWASDSPNYRVILTTRPIEGATLAPFQRIGAARYELLPFDEHALCHFAEHWFSDSPGDAAKFLRQLRKAHLDELVRVPLLATIAAIIFAQFDDRPLPDNQYELYETYLGHLRSAHPVPASPLNEHSSRLLEHLGRIRLEEDTFLVTAASTWVSEHLPELCQVPDWQERLVEYLAAVGPFIARSGDLRFLHHSFAEHLAATAKARLLPPVFDPMHPDFVELLHAARPEDRGRYARRVLLHHTRLHPAEADTLLSHLHEGGPSQHLLAARLLAWHLPAGAEAFFATAHAWAMTTQYPGREILSQVSRATHHPGLIGWLLNLTRDEDAPWPSRVEAAVALATRLNSHGRTEALETLRSVVNETAIAVQPRLDAAEALSECGADERRAAIHGLRSVLVTPSATAKQFSDAAVVLAGLGVEARAEAVEALTQLLDDPAVPEADLVTAAVGLVEIGSEFHERCATVFRATLDRRSWCVDGVEEAALGLASLGPDQLAEAAAALEQRITDGRLYPGDHLVDAHVLRQLGPQHRIRAGELVLEVAIGQGRTALTRASALATLIDCGPEFREQIVLHLRAIVEQPFADAHCNCSAGLALAKLGPSYRSEAANALKCAAAHPLAISAARTNALGQLVSLGEPYRAPALSELHAAMADPWADPDSRFYAAAEVSRLGPEFHSLAIEQLMKHVSSSTVPRVRVLAWRRLSSISPRLEEQATAAVLELVESDDWEAHGQAVTFHRSETAQPDDIAQALVQVLHNPGRSARRRCDAGRAAVYLGRLQHAHAVQGLVEMLRGRSIPDVEIGYSVKPFSQVGASLRRELNDVLRDIILSPRNHAGQVYEAAEAAAALDTLDDPKILEKLNEIATDPSVDAGIRTDAGLLRARHQPERLPEALALVIRLYPAMTRRWVRQMRELVTYGADAAAAAAGARAVLLDPIASQEIRQRAAALLAELSPELSAEAIAELRSQATDEFLPFPSRSDAVIRLVEAEPGTLHDAVCFHRSVLHHDHELIRYRCGAAYELVRLDPAATAEAREALLGLASATGLIPFERGKALMWLDVLNTADVTTTRLRLALMHDPATPADVRTQAARDLPGKERREIERTIVTDRFTSPEDWPDTVTEWDDISLARTAERELRDVLTGPETTAPQRIEAATALCRLSPRHEPEAVSILTRVSQGSTAVDKARRELARLDPTWHERVLADANGALADVTRPGRERAKAGLTVTALTSELSADVRAQLTALLSNEKIAEELRLDILLELGQLDDIRAIRDDSRRRPAIRRRAANVMRSYACEDRAAAARVFQAIANDSSCHPRLRWSAANDLAECGSRGHALGTEALRMFMADESLPVIARLDAARALGRKRPDLRDEVLAVLRSLRDTPNPVARMQVMEAIGLFEPAEGACGILDLARDRRVNSHARLWSAEDAAEKHRDYREAAALVAREIAHDEHTPRHIRVRAARLLATLSELCRSEARQLLETLHS